MKRNICDDYAALAHVVDNLVAYIDSCDEANGGDGYIDTGDVLDYVAQLRAMREEREG